MKLLAIFCIHSLALFSHIECRFNNQHQIEEIDLFKYGKILYFYDDRGFLKTVERRNSDETVKYRAEYYYSEEGRLVKEKLIGNLGFVDYFPHETISLYHRESFDSVNEIHVLDETSIDYKCALKKPYERTSDAFFFFDEKNQLIKASSGEDYIEFTYDSSGIRQSKLSSIEGQIKQEFYASCNREEIAIFNDEEELIELKVPGLPLFPGLSKPCAIEINGTVYAPILDHNHNIYALVDINTHKVNKTVIDPISFTTDFGELLSRFSFRGKIYDPDLHLVYFGFRYYNIESGCWISEDPLGPLQSEDLFNYCLNQPWKYIDPDGRFCVVIPIIGGLTFSEVIKDIAIGAAISISYDYIVPEVSLWFKKYADEKRMEEFIKIQKGEL